MLGAHMLKPDSGELACNRRGHERPNLQHFNADEGIKCFLKFSGDFAIIHQMNTNAVLKTKSFDPLLGKGFLFLGQSKSIDFTAECSCSLRSHNHISHVSRTKKNIRSPRWPFHPILNQIPGYGLQASPWL